MMTHPRCNRPAAVWATALLAAAVLPGCRADEKPAANAADARPETRWVDQRPPDQPQRPPLYDQHLKMLKALDAQYQADQRAQQQPAQEKKTYPGDETRIERLTLKETNIIDALRMIAELTGVNAVATREAREQTVSLYLQGVTTVQAIEGLCRVAGLWYRRDPDSGTFRIMTTEQYQKDLIVFRDDQTRVLKLRYPNALTAATAIDDLYGDRVELSLGIDGDQFLFGQGGGLGAGGFGGGLGGGNSFGSNFSRSGGTASQFGRSTNNLSDGGSGLSRLNRDETDRRTLRDDITADQIARLEQQLAQQGRDSDLLDALTQGQPPIFVTVNREHNLLIVRTSDQQAMADMTELVAQIDRPTPQVLLEMKILELTVGDTFRSIFDVNYLDGQSSTGPADGQPANPLIDAATATANENILGAGNFAVEGGSFVYQFLNDTVRARIQLLQSDNRMNVVASPLLLASNNRAARVFVGEQRVLTTGVNTDIIVPEGGATTTVVEPITEVRDIGNSIIILPKINADRSVTLLVNQDNSSVIPDSATIPVATAAGGIEEFAVDSVRTSQLQGIVVARDGLTVAIGGLIRSEINDIEEKVPMLGDLPFFGTAFRREARERTKTELILLITPHVLQTPGEGDRVSRERLDALSDHPYKDTGDKTNQQHFEDNPEVLEPDNPLDRKPENK